MRFLHMEWYEIAVDGERTVKFSLRVSHLGAKKHREQKQMEQRDRDAVSEKDCSGKYCPIFVTVSYCIC